MANPTFQAVSTGKSTGTVLSLAVSHTVPSSLANSTLVVMVSSTTSRVVNTGDYNGAGLTAMSVTSGIFFTDVLYMLNPPAGTANVNLTWAAFSANIMVTVYTISDTSIPDVIHTTPTGFTGGGTSTGDSITTLKDNSLILGFVGTDNSVTHTTGGSQTEKSNFTAQNTTYRVSSSYLPTTTAGSYSFSTSVSNTLTDYQYTTVSMPPTPKGTGAMFLVL